MEGDGPEQRAQRPTVSVVIVSYNRREELARVLEAYERQTQPPLEVVVADNTSHDGSAAMTRQRFPSVRVIEHAENRGFAPAVNAAARDLKGDILLFSPDDVIPSPEYVEELAKGLRAHDAHAVSGVIHEWPETARLNTAGASLSSLLRLRIERQSVPTTSEPIAVAVIPGSMAVRRDVFLGLGGFEESFGSVYEDVDLSLRVGRAGGKLFLVPSARAYHLTHPLGTSYVREYLDRKNVVIFYVRHARPTVLAAFFAYQLAFAIPRDLLRALGRRDRRFAGAISRAARWWLSRPMTLLRLRREARAQVSQLSGLLARKPV